MCGIYGWFVSQSKRLPRAKLRTLSVLLGLLNDARGGDSWGFYGSTMSEPVKGMDFISDMEDEEMKVQCSQRWLIGHTRYATTGYVDLDNAHPFVIGDVVGAHNGMVHNHRELNLRYWRDCEVDSQHIFHHIDNGMDSFSDIEAYGAIAFTLSSSPDTLYLGRFNRGSLALAHVKDFGYVYSSSHSHLKTALRAIGGKAKHFTLKDGVLYSLCKRGLYKTSLPLDFAEMKFTRKGEEDKPASKSSSEWEDVQWTLPTNDRLSAS